MRNSDEMTIEKTRTTLIYGIFKGNRFELILRACSVSRKILSSKNMNHEQRVTLQHAINNVDQKLDVESKYCVPRLADKTQKQGMIFNLHDLKLFILDGLKYNKAKYREISKLTFLSLY